MGRNSQSRRRRRLRARKHRKSLSGVALDIEGPSVGQRKRGCGLLRSSSSSHPYTSGMSSFPLSKSDKIPQNDQSICSSIMCRGMGLLQSPLLTTQVLPLPPPLPLPPWSLVSPQQLLLPPPPPLPPWPLARPQRLLLSPSPQKPMANLRSNVVPIGISTQSPFKDARKRTRGEHLSGSMGQKAAKWSCPMSTSKVEIAVANDKTVPFSDISTQDMDRNILGKKARLAWGDGLANYEKQKVQGSSDAPVVGTKNEPGKMQGSQDSLMVGTKSDPGNTIGVLGPEFSGSSSQKATLGDGAILGVDSKHNECAARLDGYPVKSVCALKPFLIDLLQPKDTYSGHSISATSIPFKQLLHLKADISKELEQTEREIDSVEREIKSLSLNSGTKSPLILSTTAYVANKVFASSPPKDHIQPGGDYLRFQSKQENPINTVNLEHFALADYDSRKLPVISSRCEEKLQNSSGMCCPENSLAQCTVAMHSHEVGSNKVQKEKEATIDQLALTKPATEDYNVVTTTEIPEATSELLSESKTKVYGNSSRMPAMILGKKESSTFDRKNGLIEDPLSFEVERTGIRPWSQQEKQVFVEMFVKFGKDFAKISSFLSNKTTADCIEYYYKNHRTASFIEAKKQFLYLVASKRKYARKKSVAALYILDGSR